MTPKHNIRDNIESVRSGHPEKFQAVKSVFVLIYAMRPPTHCACMTQQCTKPRISAECVRFRSVSQSPKMAHCARLWHIEYHFDVQPIIRIVRHFFANLINQCVRSFKVCSRRRECALESDRILLTFLYLRTDSKSCFAMVNFICGIWKD